MPNNTCLTDTQLKHKFYLQKEKYVYYQSRKLLRDAILFPLFWPFILIAPCEYENLKDYADAVVVGTTEDSLIFCKDINPTYCRLPPCDNGKTVKEMPFDKITDVIIVEPAGGCCPSEILYRVHIQTAGRSGVEGAELTIVGLSKEDAYTLRSLIKNKGRVKAQKMERR